MKGCEENFTHNIIFFVLWVLNASDVLYVLFKMSKTILILQISLRGDTVFREMSV
jgi:hypothetical protein